MLHIVRRSNSRGGGCVVGFTCGIIGLPNAGKSTVFNALSGAGAQMASYPFCTIEPNHAIVPVPDERLERLRAILGRKNAIPTKIEFVDVAGLVKGASGGEGLGNKFLSHIRSVDALVHTVRLFADDDVSHVMGGVDPIRDIDTVNTELVLSDIELLSNAREKLSRAAKAGDGSRPRRSRGSICCSRASTRGRSSRTRVSGSRSSIAAGTTT